MKKFTLSCDDHDEMQRDHCRAVWYCPDSECKVIITDEEIYRLVSATGPNAPVPVKIVVT